MFRAITSNFQWAGVYCMEWRQYRPTKFILRTFPRTFRSLFLRFFLVVIHCRKYIAVISFGKHSDCLWQLRCLKTWSLKIKPSVWFLRVVPLTNLRSNIHFELFLFTLIPACLAVGISGPVLQRIERVLSFGPRSWENIRIKSLLAKLRRRKSTPVPPPATWATTIRQRYKILPSGSGGGVVLPWKLCTAARAPVIKTCAPKKYFYTSENFCMFTVLKFATELRIAKNTLHSVL